VQEFWCPLNRMLNGAESRTGGFGEEKDFLNLPVFEPRAVQPLASRCTECQPRLRHV